MPRLSWNPSSGIHFLQEPFFVVGLIPCLLFPSTSKEPETHYGASEANRKYSNRLLDQAASPLGPSQGWFCFLRRSIYMRTYVVGVCFEKPKKTLFWCCFPNRWRCYYFAWIMGDSESELLLVFFFRNLYFTRYSVLQPTCNKHVFSLLIFMKRLLFWKHEETQRMILQNYAAFFPTSRDYGPDGQEMADLEGWVKRKVAKGRCFTIVERSRWKVTRSEVEGRKSMLFQTCPRIWGKVSSGYLNEI